MISLNLQHQNHEDGSISSPPFVHKKTNVPIQYMWPKEELIHANEELHEPLIDLEGFLKGDEVKTQNLVHVIRDACLKHGFFQVINHGIDSSLISMAHDHMRNFFSLPIERKFVAQRKPGSAWGYSGGHVDRFSSKIPWKETLSFGYKHKSSNPSVVEYFDSTLGEEFEQMGMVYQKYCDEVKELGLAILELLAISLGVERMHYREFFEDGLSIMRCNYYPPCQEPKLVLGTGPHSDPTSLTILHQDQVGGLEVFVDNQWKKVEPQHPNALVINIGDTLMALTNGKYKSGLHRAVVKRNLERKSLAFFMCPNYEKVVKPPQELVVSMERTRTYPDFKWSDFLKFTQEHYRVDGETFQRFTKWLKSSKNT